MRYALVVFLYGILTLTAARGQLSVSPYGTASTRSSDQAEVKITSSPTGASCTINGNFTGFTPQTLSMAYGEHLVELSFQGYETLREKITVNGSRTAWHFTLTRVEKPDAVRYHPKPAPEKTTSAGEETNDSRSLYGAGVHYLTTPMFADYLTLNGSETVPYRYGAGFSGWLRFMSKKQNFATEIYLGLSYMDNEAPATAMFSNDQSVVMLPVQLFEDWYFIKRTNVFYMFAGVGAGFNYWQQYSDVQMAETTAYYFIYSFRAGMGFRLPGHFGIELMYMRTLGGTVENSSMQYDTFQVGFPLNF